MKRNPVILGLVAFFTAISPESPAGEYRNEDLKFSVSTHDDWSVAKKETLDYLTQMTAIVPQAHANARGSKENVDSAVLLFHSKLSFGSDGDNPNVVVAKEKAWAEGFEKSGVGYLRLLEERFKLARSPTKFIGEPKELKTADGSTFFRRDSENTLVPDAPTRQRYLCTFKSGYYVFFVFSYNEETDADFAKMMEVFESFKDLTPK